MYSYRYPHPAVSTDIVIFTILDDRLQVLLIRRAAEPFRGAWALPGGFVEIDEDLEAGALRELEEETGIRDIYLEQLYTFGHPGRDPRERVITVAYYALVPFDQLGEIKAASDAAATAWHPLGRLPKTAFDHNRIIEAARRRLVAKLDYSNIALQFLPSRFSLGELQQVHEVITGESLDKRNFRKRILGAGYLLDTGKVRRGNRCRPARLYRARSPGKLSYLR